jgi:hypothetical protein
MCNIIDLSRSVFFHPRHRHLQEQRLKTNFARACESRTTGVNRVDLKLLDLNPIDSKEQHAIGDCCGPVGSCRLGLIQRCVLCNKPLRRRHIDILHLSLFTSGTERCHDDHDCSDHGICNEGTCICSEGWVGQDCSLCKYLIVLHIHSQQPTSVPLIAQPPAGLALLVHPMEFVNNLNAPAKVAGRAPSAMRSVSSTLRHNITCMCKCIHLTQFILSCSECPSGCSGHGRCLSGYCVCDEHYIGQDCSIEACSNECSHHGQVGSGHFYAQIVEFFSKPTKSLSCVPTSRLIPTHNITCV